MLMREIRGGPTAAAGADERLVTGFSLASGRQRGGGRLPFTTPATDPT